MKIRFSIAVLLSTFLSFNAFSAELLISEQYVRETIPGTEISSAYMTITNRSAKMVKLTTVTSSVSERIEMHEHVMTADMMKMQQVESIIINAGDNVVLQPHGYHIMVFNLQQPLKADTEISMTLHFDNQPSMKIKVPVQGLNKPEKRHQH
ncbi:hypothetical protein A9Q98_10820 [Thalassotalea sp. 42_200_T64]|nr:hypothetical protein A9Q98_10820 [Thalassotalea sp. 42_200_T64]